MRRVMVGAAGPVLAPPEKLFTGRYSFGGGLTMAIVNVVLNWLDEAKAAVK